MAPTFWTPPSPSDLRFPARRSTSHSWLTRPTRRPMGSVLLAAVLMAGCGSVPQLAENDAGDLSPPDGGEPSGDGGGPDGSTAGTCADDTQNGNETGEDCGGRCGPTCPVGTGCAADADCATGICNALTHVCGANACDDGERNNAETDVDCGGTMCNPCEGNKQCTASTDCLSELCSDNYCQLRSGGQAGYGYPTWVDGPAVPPTLAGSALAGRGYGSAVATPNAIWLIAGSTYSSGTGQTRPTGSVQILPFSATGADAWVAGDTGTNAESSQSVIYRGLVWQFGGFGALNPNLRVASHPFTPFTGGTWTPESSMPAARSYTAVVGRDDRVWLFGGVTQIQSFSPPSDWRQEGQMPERDGVAATRAGDTIYVMTGGGGTSNEAFDVITKTFTPRRAAPTGRSRAVAVYAPDGRIYLIGGDNPATARLVEAYTPETDTWTTVATLKGDHGTPQATIGPDGRLWVISGQDYGAEYMYTPRVEVYGPVVGMSPPSGPRGTQVTIGGTNFASSATTKVYWGNPRSGGVLLGQGFTAQSGHLSGLTVTIPATGDGPLYVIDQKSEYPGLGRFTIE